MSITIGAKNSSNITSTQETRQASTSVGSLAGDVLATAGGQYLQLSSDITAPQGDIHLAAQNITLQSNNNTRSVLNIVRERQSGITLAASNPLVSTAQTASEMARVAKRTENGRYQAMALLTSGLTIYNQYHDLTEGSKQQTDAKQDAALKNWTFSASLGTSQSNYESLTTSTTPLESSINAGRNVSLTATGGTDRGDINLIGSRVIASENLTLRADRDITMTAAVGRDTEKTKRVSSAASVGISFGIDGPQSGFAVNLAASRSNAWSNGWGTTFWNSELTAGKLLSVDSGRDWSLSGAKATGETVLARVGSKGAGNLTIVSPQDESFYQAKEQSFGFNASIPWPGNPYGTLSLGVNASGLKLLAENESIKQQSAVVAGLGGYDVRVNGHTHLKGSAIASKADATRNYFETQTLTHEDVVNRDVASGKSWSVSVNVSAGTSGAGAMAGSSVGFARMDTNETFITKSSIASAVNLTRPDLQAGKAAAMKAAERDPLTGTRDQKQNQLNELLWNEPPSCDGCAYNGGPTTPVSEVAGAKVGGILQTDKATPPGEGTDSNYQWMAWYRAVQALQAEINGLNTRISAVDAKVYQSTNTLSNSPSGLHQPLLHTFDKAKATQELRDGVAVTAAFGKAAFKAAGDYSKTQAAAAQTACGGPTVSNCPEADKWRDGGSYKALLHGAIGAVAGGGAGAVAGMSAELSTPYLRNALIAAGVAENSALYNLLMPAAKMAVTGGLTGAAGAAVAFNADANNRQLHLQETRWLKGKAAQLAARMSQETGRSVSEQEALFWATLAGGVSVDAKAQTSVQFLRGPNIGEEARLYDIAMQFVSTQSAGQTFVDEQGTVQQLLRATPSDRYNTFKYAELRNNAEYREFMWANAGQNLRPDAPTSQDLALYDERQRAQIKQTASELLWATVGGGSNYVAVRLLNRFSPPKTSIPLATQTVEMADVDRLVNEHSRAGSGGHTGLDLTTQAAIKAIGESQPIGTRVEVAGAGVAGPDIKFVSLKDGSVVDTVQVKTATTPRNFEANVRIDLDKTRGSEGGSRVIVVVYSNDADASQLMGKLLNMNPEKTAGRSVLVLSPTGKVIIPLQPWPKKT